MNAKEYLQQGYYLDKRIESDLKEVANLRKLSVGISSASMEEKHNPNKPAEASFTRILEKIWDYEEEINEEIDRLVDLKKEISETIDKLPDPLERLLLRYRYIHFMKWDDIALKLEVGRRRVFSLHTDALGKVEKILTEMD